MDGRLDPQVREAIADVRASGIVVVIATGRILDNLRRLVGDLRFVDAVVAENWAWIAFPESGQSTVLASPAPQPLVTSLRARGLEIHEGESVIEADAKSAIPILEAIKALEVPGFLALQPRPLDGVALGR